MIAPLRYIVSLKRRSKITVFAIAIVIMFISSTSIISYSFEMSNKELVERFEVRYYLITSSENLLESRVPVTNVHGAYIYIIPAKIENESTYVVGIYDPYNIIGKAYQCNYGGIILGEYYKDLKGDITVYLKSLPTHLHILRSSKFKFFPDYWGIINYTQAQSIQKIPNFILVPKEIHINGYITQPIMKLSIFYYKSSEEINVDLLFLTLISIVAVYFFVDSLITIEIRENIRNISIIRALGSTTRNISAIYFLRAIYIGLLGMILGTSLGIVISYLLSTLFQFSGYLTYFNIYISKEVFLTNAIISIGGGAIASIPPIRKYTRINIVSGIRGVRI